MSWREFELLVGEAFRLQGYEVSDTGGSGPDGGVDLMLRKDREKFLVQCKQWKAFKVGVAVVHRNKVATATPLPFTRQDVSRVATSLQFR